MKATDMLNQVKNLLGVELSESEITLAQLKLENGTVLEADSFEAGKEVFILTEDEKVALPVGEYELEDNRILVIEEEGLNSQLGQQAANGIFAELTFINKSYIQRAEQNYIEENFSDQEQESIMNYKSGIQSDYADKFLNSLNN